MKSGAGNKVLSLIIAVAMLLPPLPDMTVCAADSGELQLGASGVIAAFDALAEDVASQTATIGTALAALNLPDMLAVTLILPSAPLAGAKGWLEERNGEEPFEQSVTKSAAISVTWQSEPGYDSDTPGTYIFTPDIPAAYTVGAEPPVITVTVHQADGEPGEPGITFTIRENEHGSTALCLTEGAAVTEAVLLAGVAAEDENGEPVFVEVKDVGGLDLDNPQRPAPAYPPRAYVITYEAAHPDSGETFTAMRECYVTAVGIPLAADVPISGFDALDAAIQSASGGDVITIDTSFAFTGTINIPAGKNITIKGSDNTIALTAFSGARHFIIQSGAAVMFKDIILDGNGAGGGIDNSGVLIIGSNAKIQKCGDTTWSGGGIYNYSFGTVSVNSGGTVSGNTAETGGGIYNSSGTVSVNYGGIVSGNTANSSGGGIASSGMVSVNYGGTVSGNTANSGGGGIASSGTVTVNSGGMVSGNIAYTDNGGGINNVSGTVSVSGMVSGNIAYTGNGGGICAHGGTVAINSGGTFSDNVASSGNAIYHYAIGSDSKVYIKYGSEVSGGIAANEYGCLYYEVVFGVTGANGTLNASITGNPISTGDDVPHNSEVAFTAVPDGGYAVKQWRVTQWSDDGSTASSTDNPYIIHGLQNPVKVQVEFEEAELIPVTNTGGEETVAYAGTAIDLSVLSSLFTVDVDAGSRTYSIETSGSPTGSGSIGGDGKTLTVTKAGTFTIGLVTAATATHEAGAKVTATLTVNKGSQPAPTGLGKADASANGASDGKITGLTANTAYEYKKDGGGYTAAASNASGEITGLAAGSYTVRLAANDLYDASPDSAAVIIGQPAAPVKTVSVGAQTGTLTAGTAGSASFPVTTENFDNGAYIVALTGAPAGVTAGGAVITDNSGTLILSTTAETPSGTHAMTITIDGTTSDSFNLVVDTAPTYAVSVISTGTGAAGSGSYEAGATVNISAGTPPSGMQFENWTASSAVTFTAGTSAADSDASFIMPAQAVTMTANFEAVPAAVTGVTVNPSSVMVGKGATFQFNATVTGTNNPSQSVTWSVDSTAGSTIGTSGLLSVAAGETAATLTVTATSTLDSTKSGTSTVTVADTLVALPTVDSVTVTPGTITLNKGDTYTFSAAVTGTNDPSQDVIWTVTGGAAGTAITAGGVLTIAANETAAALTVRATSTVDESKSGTAAVTVTQPSQTTFIISFNANGGSVSPLTMQTGTDGKLPSLPTPTKGGGYSFDGWFTAASGGSAVTANTIFTANTTLYAHWTYTGGSGGSSSGRGSGSGGRSSGKTIISTPPPAITWLEMGPAGSLASSARDRDQEYVRTRSAGAYGVRASASKALGRLRFEHDTIADGAVQLRLYIDNPETITEDVLVSGYVKGSDVERTSGRFGKWFRNSLRVIHMDQQADWGQPVEIAARLDLTGMDTKNLYFYSYDKKANSYRRITTPAYRINADGYIRFMTPFAGDIIVSEGPLERKI